MSIHLSTPIAKLTRVGQVTAKRLANLSIATVKDLLEHYPFRYEDYSRILTTDKLAEGLIGSISGHIQSIEARKTPRKQMRLTEAFLNDGRGEIKIIWFNQPYVTQTLKEGEQIMIAGKIERDFSGWVIKNPQYEKAGPSTVHTARLVPIYPTTANITQKQIRFLVSQALEAASEFSDILPPEIINSAKLIPKPDAIAAIHLSKNARECEQAERRLKFEELFLIQLLTEQSRLTLQKAQAPKIKFQEDKTKQLVYSLPFKLTDDQRKATWQILQDLQSDRPMNRLLQGEVGSGKTVVAAIAALNAAESGYQTALMAPTEILALQHFKTISEIFPDKPIALLTSKHARLATPVIARERSDRGNPEIASPAARNDIKKFISQGKINIIIGTHAIIQQDVVFANLGLIIVDEQHRFGVKQRKLLKDKSESGKMVPHFLSMTATPIPRSLALTLYGDLDISTIREMPKDRLPIVTRIVEEKNRSKAQEFIRQKISGGGQAFVICPLISESDKLGVKSVIQEYEKLNKNIFPDVAIGLLHGRLKAKEKEEVMNDFKSGKISILVSTAVVEVGVDVSGATIMMIEGADRFGLAQLHQFRGRVGRGDKQSYCFLFTDSGSQQTRVRLQSFINARDGFEIAELDLQLRGPGQLYGTEQSGYLDNLRLAQLTDSDLISETKEYARRILASDPDLSRYPNLKHELSKQSRELHFE